MKLIVDNAYQTGEIDPRIYGSFAEHMGRVIYGGIYEPRHSQADEEGYRKDVIEAVRNAGITQVRYPGGNFVSCYHWEDGVGEKDKRPKRLDLAWRAIESNEFGTEEFYRWAIKAKVEPIFAVNLGSRGLEEAVRYLEYCNFPGGTSCSELRKRHGRENPYHIKTWCLGNEMDGAWQIGHKTSEEYGRLAAETAKAMKIVDPDIELIVCGSSLSTMETALYWEESVLEHTYEYVDYIALHQYYGGQEKGTKEFLRQADKMDEYIKSAGAICDLAKAKKHSDKKMYISVDEWGVWAYRAQEVAQQCKRNPWEQAPRISEMIYTFEDSLLFAGMMMALLKNADRVKIACQALLANVSAMIMTEENGGIWLQPIYYPFYYMANYGKGTVLDARPEGDRDENLDYVVVYNEKEEELVLFIENRSEEEAGHIQLEAPRMKILSIAEHIVLEAENKHAVNQWDHNSVKPHSSADSSIKDGRAEVNIPKLSWNMVRIKITLDGGEADGQQ